MIPDKVKIETIIKELQKMMRIQDTSIQFEFKNAIEMYKHTNDNTTLAQVDFDRKHSLVRMCMNSEPDHCDGLGYGDWYYEIMHEMYHIVTDEFMTFIKPLMDGNLEGRFKEVFEEQEERLISRLADIFITTYPVTNFNHILEG